ncbi:MAG: LuxR C-terminal-related transcriptional regulator [Alphaproteobacteria bacterium]|nr:LuxR C-terminal-related transcriptional regulator [Alphaproteobacteria bacterium]
MAEISQHDIDRFCSELHDLTGSIGQMEAPGEVLDRLHEATCRDLGINVMGAALLPEEWGDFEKIVIDQTLFLHESVPAGWWEEYSKRSRSHPSPIYAMAELSLAPFTITESMRTLDLVGEDRWSVELAHRFGIRDALACPVGGRWLFAFWSSDVMTDRLTPIVRAMLFMAANFAVIRLDRLIGAPRPAAHRSDKFNLTARELAVLRCLSDGNRIADTARILQIGDETVRTHLKKAQNKLNARTQTHVVAKAIRLQLIP